nr:adenosylcobinamide-GDP ribazoletransferase [uncultured Mogibacterium sp.]
MKITTVLKSVTVAFSMYSRIPMPRFRWETADMRYHLCFFPWVGGVIGILEYLWFLGVARFEIGPAAATLIALSVPILVTGGFHLDGFMDTCDALSSWRTREERLKILSDPHIGAFSVIRLALFGLLYGAALSELTAEGRILWMGTFFLKAKQTGLARTESDTAARRTASILLLLQGGICIAWMLWRSPAAGGTVLAIALLGTLHYRRFSGTKFGGITGDLAGWFLCRMELAMVLGLWVAGILTGIF